MTEATRDFTHWLVEARAGSREALGHVLDLCRRYLLLIAERQLGPELRAKGGASDLVQETFLEAQRDFARFYGDSEAELLAWLRTLLSHNIANFARRYRETGMRAVGREIPLDGTGSSHSGNPALAAGDPSPSSLANNHEQADLLYQALARLPDDYRDVVRLRYLEERSFEEIGQRLNRSADAARKLWARAMERLRQEWEGVA